MSKSTVDMLANIWQDFVDSADTTPARFEVNPMSGPVLWAWLRRHVEATPPDPARAIYGMPYTVNEDVPRDEMWVIYVSGRREVFKIVMEPVKFMGTVRVDPALQLRHHIGEEPQI